MARFRALCCARQKSEMTLVKDNEIQGYSPGFHTSSQGKGRDVFRWIRLHSPSKPLGMKHPMINGSHMAVKTFLDKFNACARVYQWNDEHKLAQLQNQLR